MPIRNFSIIAHIDHGKSTLADRLLEATGAIEKRRMREQFLDMMELERERGITIKMQPVRLSYQGHILNLIDTPGHIDFSYEVSRALAAVEGTLLLVDATRGVQAQTLSVLAMAQELNLVIIPVINKIDLPVARVEETKQEIIHLLHCKPEDIILVSAKTGEGLEDLLKAIVAKVPAPKAEVSAASLQGLVFDFEYSPHRGVIVYTRLFQGEIKPGDELMFATSRRRFKVIEVGVFRPEKVATEALRPGEIGYVVTGIKETGQAKVGDTLVSARAPAPALPGYGEARPVVWASLYPENQDDFVSLRQALGALQLSDSSFSFEEESSGALGRGFRVGFLGMLHLEIITERLRREFKLQLVVTLPSISYEVSGKLIYSPHLFPDDPKSEVIQETWVSAKIITPPDYLGEIIKLLNEHEGHIAETESWSETRTVVRAEMPLRELMRQFFDELKSATSGFASLTYEPIAWRPADVVRLDILVAEELVPAFSRVVARARLQVEAEALVEKLADLLPRQLFVLKIQAKALGRILSSRSLSALKKDVTGYLYGGDITRKRKLWEKQKRGKKKLLERGKVDIPQDVFLAMLNSRK